MHESWLGYPFGVADLNLDSLTIVPHCPDTHYDAYAEVANLSQTHTLAHILAETLAKPRYGLKQVKRILVLNDNSFSEDLFQLVYRSTVYRLWKRGDSGMRFYEYEGGKGFEVVLEGLDGRRLRTIDEEIKRLIKTPD
ncbi:hypothetical protein B0A49_00174 [Cryomyces minteri]|uniref:Uncharacterized protein n=1 Tax=Cryomyces minteri TaxID=331657 RepID=A0A4U0XZZ3_9PEZI|nr:hypothetical protein B0A49_00174 [Cryomyces minteri]